MIIAGQSSMGATLQIALELADAPWLLSTMLVILFIGFVVDPVLFRVLERSIRERRGLVEARA